MHTSAKFEGRAKKKTRSNSYSQWSTSIYFEVSVDDAYIKTRNKSKRNHETITVRFYQSYILVQLTPFSINVK